MPTSFDQIQPCDGRDLLQKVVYNLVVELAEKRVQVCSTLASVFEGFGINNFSPCESINDQILELITGGEGAAASNALGLLAGLPPHSLRIITQGYDSLTEEEKVEVQEYLRARAITFTQTTLLPIIQQEVAKVFVCPTPERARELLVTSQNISTVVNTVSRRFNQLTRVVNISSAAVNALNSIVTSSEAAVTGLDVTLPAVAATPSGASGPIARLISKLERFIDKKKEEIEILDTRLCNAANTLKYVNAQLAILQAFVQLIDTMLQACAVDTSGLQVEFTPTSYNRNSDPLTYRGYTLEIRTVPGQTRAPQRFAVAIDRQGVVVLQGPRSFSSSTDILIQEIKFRIDNLLG